MAWAIKDMRPTAVGVNQADVAFAGEGYEGR